MRKYDKLRYPSDEETAGIFADGELVVLEKVDGANLRFTYHDGGLMVGSRNVVFSKDDDPLPIEECNEAFRHAIRYLYETVDFDAFDETNESLVFYGEAMHKHSIDYDAWEGQEPDLDDDFPNVLLYDVWDPDLGSFHAWHAVEYAADALGLETVPEIESVPATEFDPDEYEIPESAYRDPDPDADTEFDRRGLAEGVVLRNDDAGIKAKLVHDEFREKNAIAFNDARKAQSEAGRFVAAYVTDARVRKQVHNLVDEGEFDEPDMPMMPELVPAVLRDVMEEEGWNILNDDIDLDTDTKHQVRKKASGKCASVLKAMAEAT